MRLSDMKDYTYEKLGNCLLDKGGREALTSLLDVFNKFDLHTKEMWYEVHFNNETDFIIKVCDFNVLIQVCEYFIEHTVSKSRKAWNIIKKVLCVTNNSNCEMKTYMCAVFLEFDMNEILSDSLCPCVFFEFDIMQMHKDKVDFQSIYDCFEEKILIKTLNMDIQPFKNKAIQELMKKGIYVWNIGFMMSRSSAIRLFFAPFKTEQLECSARLLNGIIDDWDCHLRDARVNEVILDCDFDGEKFDNFGINAYYNKYQDRINVLKSLVEKKYITEEEYNAVCKWENKKIERLENGDVKLIYCQFAHYKVKINKNNMIPKIYLRILEI